mgnify:CR=1 FL=1
MQTSIRSDSAPVRVRRLGSIDYRAAWELQRELADARAAGGPDSLLLLEHPPTYTAGRRTLPEERPQDGTPRPQDGPVLRRPTRPGTDPSWGRVGGRPQDAASPGRAGVAAGRVTRVCCARWPCGSAV